MLTSAYDILATRPGNHWIPISPSPSLGQRMSRITTRSSIGCERFTVSCPSPFEVLGSHCAAAEEDVSRRKASSISSKRATPTQATVATVVASTSQAEVVIPPSTPPLPSTPREPPSTPLQQAHSVLSDDPQPQNVPAQGPSDNAPQSGLPPTTPPNEVGHRQPLHVPSAAPLARGDSSRMTEPVPAVADDPDQTIDEPSALPGNPDHPERIPPPVGTFTFGGVVPYIDGELIKYLQTVPAGQRWVEMVVSYLRFEEFPPATGVRIHLLFGFYSY
jgi:hypothetical protein